MSGEKAIRTTTHPWLCEVTNRPVEPGAWSCQCRGCQGDLLDVENRRMIQLLRAIYAGGTFADDFEDWEGLQKNTRDAGIAFGQNKAATKVAKAMGWELPIGPPPKPRPTPPLRTEGEG